MLRQAEKSPEKEKVMPMKYTITRRLHCCHRLIKVVNKCTQTCRWTFLEGVLAVRSTFSASSAAFYVRAGCFLRICPRHSCGGTEMLRVLLMHSTLLLSCVDQESAPKGKSFLTGVGLASRQSQTSVLQLPRMPKAFTRPDSEMHSWSHLFEDLEK